MVEGMRYSDSQAENTTRKQQEKEATDKSARVRPVTALAPAVRGAPPLRTASMRWMRGAGAGVDGSASMHTLGIYCMHASRLVRMQRTRGGGVAEE